MSPICNCVSSGYKENGPYYVHLGHHKTQEGLQKKFEERLGVSQEELWMVSVHFTGKEGKPPKIVRLPSGSCKDQVSIRSI